MAEHAAGGQRAPLNVDAVPAGPSAVPVGAIDGICPRCGSQSIVSLKCKLQCQECHAIVMTCCEF